MELDGEADAEQQREQRKRLGVEATLSTAATERSSGLAGSASGKNDAKMETRNMVTMFMASTPNRAKPRSTSIASSRSDGFTGFPGASLAGGVRETMLAPVCKIVPFPMERFRMPPRVALNYLNWGADSNRNKLIHRRCATK
ncbi:hypothetical protein AOQ72_12390 [Bradyrhizobium yuanmingense]|uniref:Uncharacterized protein n=1 Tax=Bradyrhizobium yuanmingense TaxID=108015 RepID=A0A0R3CXI1_9BRAD|nr:hypothetical protein [Bradyrhizobium yuanmingense]KRP99947.1 hypothetical protein AOQ72_12390 [Bradyrhizobium yuanmingense]